MGTIRNIYLSHDLELISYMAKPRIEKGIVETTKVNEVNVKTEKYMHVSLKRNEINRTHINM